MPPVSYSPGPKGKGLFLFGKRGQTHVFRVACAPGRWHVSGMHTLGAYPDVTTCPACGSHSRMPHAHTLYQVCTDCGSVYQHTGRTNVDDYYHHQPIDFSFQRGSYRQYLAWLKAHHTLRGTETLIDVGAGDGTFLDTAAPLFATRKGVESSAIAREVLARKGYLAELDVLKATRPKVVTAFQVIEHVDDPVAFLKNLHLGPGDVALLTSPAVDSRTAHREKGRWRNLSPSHHLALFSRKGLEAACARAGLEVATYDFAWAACHGGWDNLRLHVLQWLKWPIKRLIGRKDRFPPYHGRESFIALLRPKA